MDQALERLYISPLNVEDVDVMQQLLLFEVENSHCYDPNEEAKLREIINTNGEHQFNSRIRDLASQSMQSRLKRSEKSESEKNYEF
jgi:hypothetical protein